MNLRAATWLAWSLCVAHVAATEVLYFLTPPIPTRGPLAFWGASFVMLSLAYPTVGAVVASRRPKNPIGWILCAVGLVLALQTFAAGYARARKARVLRPRSETEESQQPTCPQVRDSRRRTQVSPI
jgi:hypothetical protein